MCFSWVGSLWLDKPLSCLGTEVILFAILWAFDEVVVILLFGGVFPFGCFVGFMGVCLSSSFLCTYTGWFNFLCCLVPCLGALRGTGFGQAVGAVWFRLLEIKFSFAERKKFLLNKSFVSHASKTISSHYYGWTQNMPQIETISIDTPP